MIQEILRLREERRAVILAHNYQVPQVQDMADFVGDSLELSQKAAGLDAEVIVFCGVHFMAETAAILAPEKTVLIPDLRAGCPMADMITASELRQWKEEHPGKKVVCYVNTSAEVKAECDVCCTSSNAVNVVQSLGESEILFAPDKNLAAYVARYTGTRIIPWDGYCYVHHRFSAADVREMKARHPEAEVWVHPECRPEVIDLADKTLSTGKMVREANVTQKTEVILGTEQGIIHRLQKINPGARFYALSEQATCSNMKKITLPKVLKSLQDMIYRVEVPKEIAERARGAIEKMVRL